MRTLNLWLFACLTALTCGLVSGQTAPRQPSPAFAIAGQIANPRSYTLTDIQALPAKQVTLEYSAANQPQKHSFKGVPLFDLIAAAKPQLDANTKNDALRWIVQAEGSDGYTATFALGELDPNFGNKGVLVAFEQDGTALPLEDGAMRLVVAGDVKGGRFVSALTRVTVKRAQ